MSLNILIATGIYPPAIGGPAQYAKNLVDSLKSKGHNVDVVYFEKENSLPTGIRHLYFLFRNLKKISNSDFVIALDTFSVGLPMSLGCKLIGTHLIIRTGGDFLWEQYIEETKDPVFLKDFYYTRKGYFNFKQNLIYFFTEITLKFATKIVFSTNWQKEIFEKAYFLDSNKNSIIENYYGPKVKYEDSNTGEHIPDKSFLDKTFVGSTRKLLWKNIETLENVFKDISETKLFIDNLPYEELMKKIEKSYACILISLGDISPNFILDAISRNKPFILTKENGISERIKDCAIFVDPLNTEEIKEKVKWLLDEKNYNEQKKKIENFNFTHTWDQIAQEFLDTYHNIKI